MSELCPNCGFSGTQEDFELAIRQGSVWTAHGMTALADVGFRCPRCNVEFGFDIVSKERAEQ
jgi:predicted RNA-binding Zn-ribbon protein involved in translation (DUF1610 family)